MKPKQESKVGDQFVNDIKNLFDSKNTKHKQDREFLRQFQLLIKKDKQLDKPKAIHELHLQFRQIAQTKCLYFDTIIDALMMLQAKNVSVDVILKDVFTSQCQTDKKSKDSYEFEEIKLFCFQKLEINNFQDYQMNKKVIVFMERVIKQLKAQKSVDDQNSTYNFLFSNRNLVNTQTQIQTMICILIQRVILNFQKETLDLKQELRLLTHLINEQTIKVAIKTILDIAQTSMQHEYYQYIFKACTILFLYIINKSLNSDQFTLVVQQEDASISFKRMITIFKDFNNSLIQEPKDQTLLYESPRFVIDYVPTNFLLELLQKNPSNWLSMQNFIQRHPISEIYLNHTIANLCERQCKIYPILKLLKKDRNKTISISSWLSSNQALIMQTQQQESGNYNSYIYCQLHFLLFLQSINSLASYFNQSNIKWQSRLFKQLFILRMEHCIFKYQQNPMMFKVSQGNNSYYTYLLGNQLQTFVKQFGQTDRNANSYKEQIKLMHIFTTYMVKKNQLYQCPFISKMPCYIDIFMKNLIKSSVHDNLYVYDQQIYFGFIIHLSFYSKQAFHQFIIQLFNAVLENSKPNPKLAELTEIQVCMLEEVGVRMNSVSLEENPLNQMILDIISFFLNLDKPSSCKFQKLTEILQNLKNFIKIKEKDQEKITKIYRSLINVSLDRFLMLNGLQQFSLGNQKSRFQTFFRSKLNDNIIFIEMILQIVVHSKHSSPSDYLKTLAILYLQDASYGGKYQFHKFQIFCYVLFPSIAKTIILAGKSMTRAQQFYTALYRHQQDKNYQSRKHLLSCLLEESKTTREHYNILIKLIQ